MPTSGVSKRASPVWGDVRFLQIAMMLSLLAGGVLLRDFSIRPEQVLLSFAAGLSTQAFFLRRLRLDGVGFLSAVISCTAVSLLLRADNLWAHPAAAVLANGSKFVLRARGKHLFNPANFGVIAALSFFPGTWVSAGQWGADFAVAGWLGLLGMVAAGRAGRGDISCAFIVSFMGLLGLRVLWLGQIFGVWSHALQNGALILFTFFMISDPKTSPDHRVARVLHAALVAGVAYGLMFGPYLTNSFLWALFVASPIVPLWDHLFSSDRYFWAGSLAPRRLEQAGAGGPA